VKSTNHEAPHKVEVHIEINVVTGAQKLQTGKYGALPHTTGRRTFFDN
jgi:hypothetical protein